MTNSSQTANRSHIIRLAIVGLIAAIGIGALIFGGTYLAQLEAIVLNRATEWGQWVASHAVLYALIFVLIYTLISAFGLPLSVVLSLGGGALSAIAFGFWGGTVYSAILVWVSVVLGSWGLFEFVKRFGASSFDALVGPYVERFRVGFERDQFFYMLSSRFTPLPPSVMTIVPALLGANRFQFVLAAAVGFLPGVSVYAALGAKLGELLLGRADGQEVSFATVVTLENTWPLLALLALSLIPILVRRFSRSAQS